MAAAPPRSSDRSAAGARAARTRGGWAPTGTAAARRAGHPPPGSKAARTRDRLLDAARVVARRNGYHDTTVELVVTEARVARGSFYSYFESKHDVLRALVSRVGTAIDRDVAFVDPGEADEPATDVRRATASYLTLAREHADLLRLVDQMAAVDEQVARDRDESHRRYAAQVAAAIERWQAAGLADPEIDARTTATALVAMLVEVGRGCSRSDRLGDGALAPTVAHIWMAACGLEEPATIDDPHGGPG